MDVNTSIPVEIDYEHNVAYLVLNQEPREEMGRISRSERFRDVVLDFDETGRLVGIALLNAAAVFGPRKP